MQKHVVVSWSPQSESPFGVPNRSPQSESSVGILSQSPQLEFSVILSASTSLIYFDTQNRPLKSNEHAEIA